MKHFCTLVKVKRNVHGEVESVTNLEDGFYASIAKAEEAGVIIAAKENCEIVAMKSFSICKCKFENICE
jgi:transcription elongation factor